MKIPVWFATVLMTAMLGACGIAFEHLSAQMQKTQNDIVELKVDVAMIKARVAPELATADARSRRTEVRPLP